MIAQYSGKDYANWIFRSTNRNPLPIKQGNRRIAVCGAPLAREKSVSDKNF